MMLKQQQEALADQYGTLVLARKAGQVIDYLLEDGRKIELVVLEIRGDKVRLAHRAPRTVEILRREISQRREAEQLRLAPDDHEAKAA